jgi:hypothetical protein
MLVLDGDLVFIPARRVRKLMQLITMCKLECCLHLESAWQQLRWAARGLCQIPGHGCRASCCVALLRCLKGLGTACREH